MGAMRRQNVCLRVRLIQLLPRVGQSSGAEVSVSSLRAFHDYNDDDFIYMIFESKMFTLNRR